MLFFSVLICILLHIATIKIALFSNFTFPICQRTSFTFYILRYFKQNPADNKVTNLQAITPYLIMSIELVCFSVVSLCLQLFKVEDIGVEPMTLCVQGRCSSQLS